nr:PD40 domain-containing protein [Thermoleophilaceae bacterium]
MTRGALLAAAATLPLPELAQALRRKPGGPNLDCLSAEDRWLPADLIGDCSLASFSPDGTRIACQTSRGVEIRPRAGGAATLVAPPGFTIGPRAWHPDGSVLLAAGTDPGTPGEFFKDSVAAEPALFAVKTDGSGQTRLLPDVAGVPRAASFSPDGTRVAFTLLDRFVHRIVVADWANGALGSPRVLLPFDPRQETDSGKLSRGLAWYETEGFTPDGQALVFLSDRAAGLLNASVWRIDMTSGKVSRVTRDDGFTEGAALTPDGRTLLYGSTRAREPAFATLVTAVGLPPLLGFVASPTLHETLTQRGLAGIGNGDVLAANPATGLFTRLISTRELLVAASKNGLPEAEQRIEVVSMSPSGAEVAVAVWAGAAPGLVVLR